MRPTGPLHLGHLVGALRSWKKLQEEYECFFMVADYHALMSEYEHPERIREWSLDNVTDWLAGGIDPARFALTIPRGARIKELEQQYSVQDWRVALTIAAEIADQRFCTFETKERAMDVGIRVGIAYVTNGIVSSPLEGFVRLEVRKRKDEGTYVALFFSGPIRSAGGTGASLSVLIGDYVRKHLGYGAYDPTEEEIKRMVTELYDYHEKVTNLQYLPSEEEIKMMVNNLPVQIEGDPSERYAVSNYKGLTRVSTDTIRNGPCLVLGEGLCQKAVKLHKQLTKWGKSFGLAALGKRLVFC